MVVLIGKNGKVLSTTEELNTRRSCFNNIRAQADRIGQYQVVECQDDTLMEYCFVLPSGEVRKAGKEHGKKYLKPPYIPGKNTKKKIRK